MVNIRLLKTGNYICGLAVYDIFVKAFCQACYYATAQNIFSMAFLHTTYFGLFVVNKINLKNAKVLQHYSSVKLYYIFRKNTDKIQVMYIYWVVVIIIIVKYFVVLTT